MGITEVKICGLRRAEDVAYVNKVLPEYVGFVFSKSRRRISLSEGRELISHLDTSIKTVGVFVNEQPEYVKAIAEGMKLEVLQFHGNEDKAYIGKFKEYECWKSVGIKVDEAMKLEELISINQKLIDGINESMASGILLDSQVKGSQGGTGTPFNWEIIKHLDIKKQLILAGGLSCENIAQAVRVIKPNIVDVSSGVESNGIKDFNKIQEFINKVRG